MPIRICSIHGRILDVAVEVQRLRVAELGVGHSSGFGGPVGRGKTAEGGVVVAGAEFIQTGFSVALFASEFVLVWVWTVVNVLILLAPERKEIRVIANGPA